MQPLTKACVRSLAYAPPADHDARDEIFQELEAWRRLRSQVLSLLTQA
jgi:hypothetical protein